MKPATNNLIVYGLVLILLLAEGMSGHAKSSSATNAQGLRTVQSTPPNTQARGTSVPARAVFTRWIFLLMIGGGILGAFLHIKAFEMLAGGGGPVSFFLGISLLTSFLLSIAFVVTGFLGVLHPPLGSALARWGMDSAALLVRYLREPN